MRIRFFKNILYALYFTFCNFFYTKFPVIKKLFAESIFVTFFSLYPSFCVFHHFARGSFSFYFRLSPELFIFFYNSSGCFLFRLFLPTRAFEYFPSFLGIAFFLIIFSHQSFLYFFIIPRVVSSFSFFYLPELLCIFPLSSGRFLLQLFFITRVF